MLSNKEGLTHSMRKYGVTLILILSKFLCSKLQQGFCDAFTLKSTETIIQTSEKTGLILSKIVYYKGIFRKIVYCKDYFQ